MTTMGTTSGGSTGRGRSGNTGNIDKIILAEPRGFCAGVDMAIKALIWLVVAFADRRIYCYHEIVHNRIVARWFEDRGVTFIDDLGQIAADDGQVALMLSAHGSSPAVRREAERRFEIVVDAVCPLVRKVHREMNRREDAGDTIVYLSEPDGHDEAVGTLGHALSDVIVVHRPDQLDGLDLSEAKVSLLTQTTLPYELHTTIRARLQAMAERVWVPSKQDLCFATTNRQAAVRAMAPLVDTIVVAGSATSSNTKSLALVARAAGVSSVYRANSVAELPPALSGVVGITAGASAPDELVESICRHLMPTERGIEVLIVTEEDEYFPQPPSLRALAADQPGRSGPFDPEPGRDRMVSASDLLVSL
jgi:4-hydroxy-3-methylbut-2-enyl diphosphate reductase